MDKIRILYILQYWQCVGIGTNNPDSKIHNTTHDNSAITTNLLNFKITNKCGIYATSTTISSRDNTLDFLFKRL